jgi:20S proteasome alpha/beta subunit
LTLLVGSRCEGGVVVASDSAAAYTSGFLITIGQQEVQKVHKVSDDLVYASTGAIGVSQLIIAELTKIDGQKYFSMISVNVATKGMTRGCPFFGR